MTDARQTPLRIDRPDDAYAALLDAHEGLAKSESDALNARLILLLMNEVGDLERIKSAIAAAQSANAAKPG